MSLSKKEAFSFTEEHKAIRPKIGELASILIKGKLNDIIPQDNVLRYSHGKSWKVHRDDGFDEEVDQFKTASATLEIKFDDVLAHNLQAIPDFFDSLINQMYDSHMKSFVELLTNVTNKTGNIVSAKEIGNAPAFLEMLRKVEFGINSKGEVSLPQIMVSPQSNLLKELEQQDDNFKAEVEKIKQLQTEKALKKEILRKGKFKKISDE